MCKYPVGIRTECSLSVLEEVLIKLTVDEAISLLRYESYQYRGQPCSPSLVRDFKNLLVNSVARHQRPTCSLITVWLPEDSELAISRLVDFIRDYFAVHPIKDGKRNGQPVTRSRGEVLVKWRRELKAPSATGNFSDSGIHYHIAICWCAKRSNKRFIHALFNDAIRHGIVKAPTVQCSRPYVITGEHCLAEEDGLLAAAFHVARYCSKQQTCIKNGRRQTGGTCLQLLYEREKK